MYYHYFALVSRQSAALKSATQHAMHKSGERSVLALGFLRLSCCVRGQQLKMILIFYIYNILSIAVAQLDHGCDYAIVVGGSQT